MLQNREGKFWKRLSKHSAMGSSSWSQDLGSGEAMVVFQGCSVRIRAYIDGIFKSRVPPKVFQALAQLCPEGVKGSERHAFGFTFDDGDPRAEMIERILNDAGLTRRAFGASQENEKQYIYSLIRAYDDLDLATCELLYLWPSIELKYPAGEASSGLYTVQEDNVPRGGQMVRNCGHGIFVSNKLRLSVRRTGFVGAATRHVIPIIVKRPTSLTHEMEYEVKLVRSTWKAFGRDPWWQLTSTIQMPPLHSSIQLFDVRKNPVPRGYNQGFCGFSDGFYRPAEHKYLRSDIEKMPPFDIATSAEGDMSNKWLIVSNRFYRYCRAKKIKGAGFRPVRILE